MCVIFIRTVEGQLSDDKCAEWSQKNAQRIKQDGWENDSFWIFFLLQKMNKVWHLDSTQLDVKLDKKIQTLLKLVEDWDAIAWRRKVEDLFGEKRRRHVSMDITI